MNETRQKLGDLRISDDDRSPDASGGRRWGLVALAAVLLVLALGAGWWLTRPRAVEVETATVVREGGGVESRAAVLDASGYVVARLRATVSSKITGKIEEVLVEEGVSVEEGQVLARLDASGPQRQVRLAEAELASAKSSQEETRVLLADARRSAERSRSLAEQDILSTSMLDEDQATADALAARLELGRDQIAVAERRLAVARQALDDTVVRAPFAGMVVTKDAQPGEMISPVSAGGGFTRTGICTLVDMNSLEIEVDVNEAFITRVRPDQPVRAVLNAYPDWDIPTRVITPVPTADRQRATVRVRIAFEEMDERILPEMGVKVSFLEEAEPVPTQADRPRLWIPTSAARQDDGGTFAWVVEDGTARRRAIETGTERSERVEVARGLTVGEVVVTENTADLSDGQAVRAEAE
ncbi:MAG: efflux RND transporter periplasmic adaptor subunit [Acidobacteriota bacterium]